MRRNVLTALALTSAWILLGFACSNDGGSSPTSFGGRGNGSSPSQGGNGEPRGGSSTQVSAGNAGQRSNNGGASSEGGNMGVSGAVQAGTASAMGGAGEGGTGGVGDEFTLVREGFVRFDSFLGGPDQTTVNAGFTLSRSKGNGPCPREQHGACEVIRCAGAGPAGRDNPASAGNMRVEASPSGLNLGLETNDVNFAYHGHSNIRLQGGELLQVTATGATVPAFSVGVRVPPHLAVTSPTEMGILKASRFVDLKVDFIRGEEGLNFIAYSTLTNSFGESFGDFVQCVVASTDGTLTIPASVLQLFFRSQVLNFGTSSKIVSSVGDWTITFYTHLDVVTPDDRYGVLVKFFD